MVSKGLRTTAIRRLDELGMSWLATARSRWFCYGKTARL